MKFLGRVQEIKGLQNAIAYDGTQVLLVYGRRRVGKSELIKQVLRESSLKSLYYECKQTTEMNNVQSLSALISELFGYPLLAFASFEDILTFLFKAAERESLVLVLDEYPYLRASVSGLDSILQSLIDTYREVSSLKLILCGHLSM